ncbi:periplasmic heavy metal sensor [bacterium]|nr:periplasmic heavy metal sensor [bacterium]
MRKIVFTVTAMIVGLLMASASAYACGGCGWGHGQGMGNSHAAVPDDARLSGDQQTTIDKIQKNYKGRFDSLNSRIDDANTTLDTELAKSEPNLAKIKDLRKQRADMIAEMESLRVQMNVEVKKVLSEVQRSYYGDYAFCPCGMRGHSQGMHSGNSNAPTHGGYYCDGWGW